MTVVVVVDWRYDNFSSSHLQSHLRRHFTRRLWRWLPLKFDNTNSPSQDYTNLDDIHQQTLMFLMLRSYFFHLVPLRMPWVIFPLFNQTSRCRILNYCCCFLHQWPYVGQEVKFLLSSSLMFEASGGWWRASELLNNVSLCQHWERFK